MDQHNGATERRDISDSFVKLKNPDQSFSWSEKKWTWFLLLVQKKIAMQKKDECTVLDIHVIEFIFRLKQVFTSQVGRTNRTIDALLNQKMSRVFPQHSIQIM